MDLACGSVHKNESNILPGRTEQASSIKFLLLWLYFEFPDGTAHFIGDNARATITRENLFLLRHLAEPLPKFLVRQQKKGFYLTSKSVVLNFFSRTQISSRAAILAVRIAKFGQLREPIRMLLFNLDQFSHIIISCFWRYKFGLLD